jgi:hypothetical protein
MVTQDEIIGMAKEAGFHVYSFESQIEQFNRFAKLVAAKEREACLKLAEKYQDHWTIDAIRARGEA